MVCVSPPFAAGAVAFAFTADFVGAALGGAGGGGAFRSEPRSAIPKERWRRWCACPHLSRPERSPSPLPRTSSGRPWAAPAAEAHSDRNRVAQSQRNGGGDGVRVPTFRGRSGRLRLYRGLRRGGLGRRRRRRRIQIGTA